MNFNEINISRKITIQLLHLAQLSPDREICGLIGSDQQGLHYSCYPITNIAGTPDNRFLLDSAEQITAMKEMRKRNEILFAIYHSHPTTPAIPSSFDLKHAAYPSAVRLIISLQTPGVLEMRAYRIIDQNCREVNLNLTDP